MSKTYKVVQGNTISLKIIETDDLIVGETYPVCIQMTHPDDTTTSDYAVIKVEPRIVEKGR